MITRFRRGGHRRTSDTLGRVDGHGRRLLQVQRDRQAEVLRFAHDLAVPPTSNQAERDLRPPKCQQNISGRLTSEDRAQDRYTIRGFVSTAVKHGLNPMTALRNTLLGRPWMPDLPAAKMRVARSPIVDPAEPSVLLVDMLGPAASPCARCAAPSGAGHG